MIHELAMAHLKAIFILFFSKMEVGVKQLDNEEDKYGVWLKTTWSQNTLEELMSKYDADWVFWQHKGNWGCTHWEGVDGNPENQAELEHDFKTKDWHKVTDQLFDLFKMTFMHDLNTIDEEYMKYD